MLTIFIVTCFSRPCFSSSESTVLLLSCTAWFESMVCSWEPTLAVVEGSQDPACKRFPDWNGPDRGEPGETAVFYTALTVSALSLLMPLI